MPVSKARLPLILFWRKVRLFDNCREEILHQNVYKSVKQLVNNLRTKVVSTQDFLILLRIDA